MKVNTQSPKVNPKIFIGDRGFLAKYGSTFSNKEILETIESISNLESYGFSYGDFRTASVIGSFCKQNHIPSIYHSPSLLTIIGSTTDIALNNYTAREFNLNRFDGVKINLNQIKEDLKVINSYEPTFVSMGGDWLDIALQFNSKSLIQEVLNSYKYLKYKYSVKFLMLSFYVTKKHIDLYKDNFFDGFLIPVNLLQEINHKELIQNEVSNPLIISIQCLAGGQIPIEPALDYVFNHQMISSAIIGVSSQKHISRLKEALRNISIERD